MPSNEYMRKYMLDRYYRRKAAAIAQLGGECVRCGTTENLEFDHIDPATKLFVIGRKLGSVAEAKLQAELAKCQLLCFSCHLDRSREDGMLARGGGHNRIENPEHGTPVMYNRERCRCETCREWKRRSRKSKVAS